nr:hypothetical protein 6 [bacterium]
MAIKGAPTRDTMDGVARTVRRLRQTAAGIVKQALLAIEEKEPLPKYGEKLMWADKQALETAYAALTAPRQATDDEKDPYE